MKEQLISFDTAKLAKEKGFNEQCSTTYNSLGKVYIHKTKRYNSAFKKITATCTHSNQEFINEKYSAPTQSLLQKWLREEHNHHVTIHPKITPRNDIVYYAYEGKPKLDWANTYTTYEEALEKDLKEALKLIK